MIYVINSANRNEHREFLEEQFRIRHEIFVKEKGWHDFERAKQYVENVIAHPEILRSQRLP